ncbi:MAG: hypothetical protein AAF748_04610 [Pseudomonadota bacterium]
MREYQIGALWIGGALSFVEQLCLKSFVDAGHHVKLFTYEPVEHVPDAVELADANAILPMQNAIRHSRTGSPAPQADRFRYHLLAQSDDIIWADTDAYCVQPFHTESGHFYGWESDHSVNNGVLGLPRDSETLDALLAFTADEYAIPEWLPGPEQDALRAAKERGEPVGVGDQAWGAWGPRALTWYLQKTGEIRHALPREALYPISFKERRLLVKPGADVARHLTPNTRSIHFYGRRIRKRLQEAEGGAPKPDSLMAQLLDKHQVDPSQAPLPPLRQAYQKLRPEDRHGRGALNLTDLADRAGSDQGALRHNYTSLYHMLFQPMRRRKLHLVLVGLDSGRSLDAPDRWQAQARAHMDMWLSYFPAAQITLLDQAAAAPLANPRLRYAQINLDDPATLAQALGARVDIVIDDATHASHHQQGAFRALFPQLAAGGLYAIEDLRTQPAPLEQHGALKTAALFQDYLETGVFHHPDAAVEDAFNGLRQDISGCFVFPAQFKKGRRDQLLVVHKR